MAYHNYLNGYTKTITNDQPQLNRNWIRLVDDII